MAPTFAFNATSPSAMLRSSLCVLSPTMSNSRFIPQRVDRVERFRIHAAADRSIVAGRSTVTATSIRVQSTRPILATAPDDRVTETATLPGEGPNHASRLLLLNCEPQPEPPLEIW